MVLQDTYCHFQPDLAMTNVQVAIVPINIYIYIYSYIYILLFQHQECNKAHAPFVVVFSYQEWLSTWSTKDTHAW